MIIIIIIIVTVGTQEVYWYKG